MKKETKDLRFKRVASKRVNKIIEDFRLLGQCSNTESYIYNKKQTEKIFKKLDEVLFETENKFQREEKGFKL